LSKNIWTILSHPILVYEASVERGRLQRIREDYTDLKSLPLIMFFKEEEGILDVDFNNAARKTRPRIIKKFINDNDINNTKLDKKLVKIKK
jgi:hypothetical protein